VLFECRTHSQIELQWGQPVDRARILLADDNELLVGLTAQMLTPSFDVVGIANDGRELVSKALLLQPDVIVVDITMSDLTGIEAIRQLTEAGSGAKVVFLTVHREDEYLQACLEEGALGYVVKTDMRDDLIPAINAAIAGTLFVSPSLSMSEDRS
jgi:DNA-binding NarL/FixJ family response regulator